MAKKSAKSKGYRKQTTKKPYLSKRDIVLLCVLVAALAVGAFFLLRYDDGALKVKNGTVVTDGDNWLIINGSSGRGTRYFKVGEVDQIEGYERVADSSLTDPNIPSYNYKAEAEDAAIRTLGITGSHTRASALSGYAANAIGGIDGNTVGALETAEIGGRQVCYFIYTTEEAAEAEEAAETEEAEETEEPAETAETEESVEAEEAAETEETAEAEEAEETEESAEAEEAALPFGKTLCAYIDAPLNSSIVLRVEGSAETAEALPADEDMVAELEKALAAVTLEEAK